MPQPHERHMTPITDRRAALAFVTQYASTALSACSMQRAASLANWILLNRTGMEPDELPKADDETEPNARCGWPSVATWTHFLPRRPGTRNSKTASHEGSCSNSSLGRLIVFGVRRQDRPPWPE